MRDTSYRKEMKASARKKRALMCLALNQYSLNKVGAMLQGTELINVTEPNDYFSKFFVEPLHCLHLRILKTFKECTVAYLFTQELETSPSLLNNYRKKFRFRKQ